MSLLSISFLVNCLVLIVSAQEEAVSTVSASTDPSSWPSSSDYKPRIVAKEWNECGTNCPLTCAQPKSRPCNFMCKADWFCPKGYYENSVGQCVLLEDCNLDSTIPPPPPQHLPGHIVGRPRPRPRPFPFGFRPVPFPRPNPFSDNSTDISNGLGRFPEFPNFPDFNSTETELPKFHIPMGPPRPRPIFQIDPVSNTATRVGAPIPPPAVVRTSGSNLPFIGLSMVPKSKPLIDLDPTVPRPVTRVSQERSSDK